MYSRICSVDFYESFEMVSIDDIPKPRGPWEPIRNRLEAFFLFLTQSARRVSCSLSSPSMSKRRVTGTSRSRKKRKESGYTSVDLDLSDEHLGEVEVIRVWDVGTSKTTGRISATRKAHQHVGLSKPTREEPTLTDADVGIPADPESPTRPVAKRKKVRTAKENDSVSIIAVLSFY